MTCHKKCITKCQNSTICGPVDALAASAAVLPSVEFKVTEAEGDGDEIDDFEVNDEVCIQLKWFTERQQSNFNAIPHSQDSATTRATSSEFQ